MSVLVDRGAAVVPGVGDVGLAGGLDGLEDLFCRVLAPVLARREPRLRAWSYLAAELGDPGGVLVADETGLVKSGRHSAGVRRRCSGTAGGH